MQRYSRQIILPNFGNEAQNLLAKSKVLVVGAGGLGVPVLQYLAAAGVGKLGIADGDVVEVSNLQRQVLYNETELGKNKARLILLNKSDLNSKIDENINEDGVIFMQESTQDKFRQFQQKYGIKAIYTIINYLLNLKFYYYEKTIL